MASDGTVSLEEFDGEGRDAALLNALGGVPGQHIANPLPSRRYGRAIARNRHIAKRLCSKHHLRV